MPHAPAGQADEQMAGDVRVSDFSCPCFLADDTGPAQHSRQQLIDLHGNSTLEGCDVIIALGGDGFMLQTLHGTRGLDKPVYGMNRGSVGFLMNRFAIDQLAERLRAAEMEVINPLRMHAHGIDGDHQEALAINEVSLFRARSQAVKLRVLVDGRVRLDELSCDGALVATPAGSTAYNYSAHGPILPIGSDVLALTAMAAIRPRRWRGALLPKSARVEFEVLEPDKRPVVADADGKSACHVARVEIESEPTIGHRLLFDQGHGLEERLLREQFA